MWADKESAFCQQVICKQAINFINLFIICDPWRIVLYE